jgi:hypothetical protein
MATEAETYKSYFINVDKFHSNPKLRSLHPQQIATIRLLHDYMWISGPVAGQIEDNDEELSSILGLDPREWRQLKTICIAKGLLYNETTEDGLILKSPSMDYAVWKMESNRQDQRDRRTGKGNYLKTDPETTAVNPGQPR